MGPAIASESPRRAHDLAHLPSRPPVGAVSSIVQRSVDPQDPRLRDDALATMLARVVQQRDPASTAVLARGVQKRASKARKRNDRHRHRHVENERLNTRASSFRFFRRLQYAHGGARNIAMLKFVKGKGKKREVLYVVARSMGLGVSKLSLRDEDVLTKGGTLKKRSHSEAVLRAVLEVGTVKTPRGKIDLSGYRTEYAASTNEGCGSQHENCSIESVPLLAPKFLYSNPYGGSSDAGGFEKRNNKHQRKVNAARKAGLDDGYGSDTESEDEYESYVIEEDQLKGLDVEDDDPSALDVTPFHAYITDGPKPRKRRYDEPGRQLNS